MQLTKSTKVEIVPHSHLGHVLFYDDNTRDWSVKVESGHIVARFPAFQTAVRFLLMETEIPFDRWSVVTDL